MKHKGIIFDLDQTLICSKPAESLRKQRRWQEVYSMIPSLVPYSGVTQLIERLGKAGIKTAIVTTAPGSYCSRVIQHWKWRIDATVCYHDVQRIKPHPEAIILALLKLRLSPNNTISVGDRDSDIIASKNAGVKTGACLWGCENPDSVLITNPDYVFKTIPELADYIFN